MSKYVYLLLAVLVSGGSVGLVVAQEGSETERTVGSMLSDDVTFGLIADGSVAVTTNNPDGFDTNSVQQSAVATDFEFDIKVTFSGMHSIGNNGEYGYGIWSFAQKSYADTNSYAEFGDREMWAGYKHDYITIKMGRQYSIVYDAADSISSKGLYETFADVGGFVKYGRSLTLVSPDIYGVTLAVQGNLGGLSENGTQHQYSNIGAIDVLANYSIPNMLKAHIGYTQGRSTFDNTNPFYASEYPSWYDGTTDQAEDLGTTRVVLAGVSYQINPLIYVNLGYKWNLYTESDNVSDLDFFERTIQNHAIAGLVGFNVTNKDSIAVGGSFISNSTRDGDDVLNGLFSIVTQYDRSISDMFDVYAYVRYVSFGTDTEDDIQLSTLRTDLYNRVTSEDDVLKFAVGFKLTV